MTDETNPGFCNTAEIYVRDRFRAIDQKALKVMKDSIDEFGMNMPIQVRRDDDGKYVLVDGAHRLEASKQLEIPSIAITVVDASAEHAKILEIIANLHRADLTVAQRYQHINELAHLMDRGATVIGADPEAAKGGRGKKGGKRAMARAAEVHPNEMRRAFAYDSLRPETKQALVDWGLDDNATAIREVTQKTTPEEQLSEIERIVGEKADAKARRCRPQTLSSALEDTATSVVREESDPPSLSAAEECGDDAQYESEPDLAETQLLTMVARLMQSASDKQRVQLRDLAFHVRTRVSLTERILRGIEAVLEANDSELAALIDRSDVAERA